ncbi:COBRA-like protein 7 [Impatiens glandulifera]|uniref:COBRA-like protein 7 n=1 Tax=Impatiens glandulifera TaxID=253017 RepID=UPI001FB0EC82|nr:COBRA-like protein 7 [Impatiens glandulifera]
MAANLWHKFSILIFTITTLLTLPIISIFSQSQPSNNTCNSIFISYTYNTGHPLPPNISSDPTLQPYQFKSTLTIINNGLQELKSWRVFLQFQNSELLVSASNANFLAQPNQGILVFGNYPTIDLKSAVQTAGDINQMSVIVNLLGTQFGVAAPDIPLPQTVTLANDGFICPSPAMNGNNELVLCCTEDPEYKSNVTLKDNDFSPYQNGDLIIMYDVIQTYDSNYWAHVTISNQNPIARLDNWRLSWDWTEEEFIYSMKGAYTSVVDTTDCLFGKQGQFYKDLDFSSALNCERRPTIIDLPNSKTNDVTLGSIPSCCRNGTILPSSMDLSRTKSAFLVQVYKMPPYLNRTILNPPQNWRINGTFGSEYYKCASPIRVSPSSFPDSSGLPVESSAFASWQVICNITKFKSQVPKCCVSFSSFYNTSIIPCNTCACGCSNSKTNGKNKVCNASAPAALLPFEALTIPPENRTKYVEIWAKMNRMHLSDPIPCEDNCGININWHLVSDYKGGWTARMTVLNWGELDFHDWFVAADLDTTISRFESAESVNGTALTGDEYGIVFLQDYSGKGYLNPVTVRNGRNPRKNFRVPGVIQSMISFSKKTNPGWNLGKGDGFPKKVYFSGEECSIPSFVPSSGYILPTKFFSVCSMVLLVIFIECLTGCCEAFCYNSGQLS